MPRCDQPDAVVEGPPRRARRAGTGGRDDHAPHLDRARPTKACATRRSSGLRDEQAEDAAVGSLWVGLDRCGPRRQRVPPLRCPRVRRGEASARARMPRSRWGAVPKANSRSGSTPSGSMTASWRADRRARVDDIAPGAETATAGCCIHGTAEAATRQFRRTSPGSPFSPYQADSDIRRAWATVRQTAPAMRTMPPGPRSGVTPTETRSRADRTRWSRGGLLGSLTADVAYHTSIYSTDGPRDARTRAAGALPTSQAAGHVWTGCPVATYSR
jgi:hypothetical protein